MLSAGGSGDGSESHFLYTMGAPRGSGRADFPLGLPVPASSSFSRTTLICQAALSCELGRIDSSCLRPFSQKRITAKDNEQASEGGCGLGSPEPGTGFPKATLGVDRGPLSHSSCHVNTHHVIIKTVFPGRKGLSAYTFSARRGPSFLHFCPLLKSYSCRQFL